MPSIFSPYDLFIFSIDYAEKSKGTVQKYLCVSRVIIRWYRKLKRNDKGNARNSKGTRGYSRAEMQRQWSLQRKIIEFWLKLHMKEGLGPEIENHDRELRTENVWPKQVAMTWHHNWMHMQHSVCIFRENDFVSLPFILSQRADLHE